MSNKYQPFRAIRKPVGLKSSFDLVVVDGVGKPHLPLTIFYHKFRQQRSDGTARTYLNNILPFFSYLTTDAWRLRRGDRWNSPPCDVLEAVRDYLVERLKCKVQPKDTYAFVGLTEYSPPTVRLFLAALKQFYFIMNSEGKYAYTNPLLDMASQLLRELERDEPEAHHRAPQVSGVEEPCTKFPSENFFRVAHEEWEVHPVENPDLGKILIEGFAKAGFSLRDQIVVRMALETGGRIREILRLTVGDWRARGCNQEVKAFSKGSRGRRVKTLRFSSTTAKMLLQYINTDRARNDPELLRLDRLADREPLFLSQRGKPYDYEAFKPHWKKLCRAVEVTLRIHDMRHWYVTEAMRLIAETATSSAEVTLEKERLVRYMAWRDPKTLEIYEKYFKNIQHYSIQDRVHRKLEKDLENYVAQQQKGEQYINQHGPAPAESQFPNKRRVSSKLYETQSTSGWGKLLALGGGQ